MLADIKVFEQHKLQGFGVITANTVQTEDDFVSANWVSKKLIKEQLQTLLNRYEISGLKIGLVSDLEDLIEWIMMVKKVNEKCLVVWDPVLSASAGFNFNHCLSDLKSVLQLVDYITPNWNEIQQLTQESPMEGAKTLTSFCGVYLKGGHSEDLGKDYLFAQHKVFPINMKVQGTEKHGSGCVLSSAFVANLVKGKPVLKAALQAKRYTEERLVSNPSKLAYHA